MPPVRRWSFLPERSQLSAVSLGGLLLLGNPSRATRGAIGADNYLVVHYGHIFSDNRLRDTNTWVARHLVKEDTGSIRTNVFRARSDVARRSASCCRAITFVPVITGNTSIRPMTARRARKLTPKVFDVELAAANAPYKLRHLEATGSVRQSAGHQARKPTFMPAATATPAGSK